MSREVNRAARRSEARKSNNRKTGMAALSIMATTSLLSSYVSLLRTEPSFAAPGVVDTSGCASVLPLTLDVSGTASEDVARIDALQVELNNAISSGIEECVTVTFTSGTGEGEDVLNFTESRSIDDGYGNFYNYNYNYSANLELFSTYEGNNPKIIFIGNDVTFEFSFDDYASGPTVFSDSPIRTDLALEIHDITFQYSTVVSPNANARGGVIRAEDNLAIYGSEFYGNSVNGNSGVSFGGAIFAYRNVSISDTTFANNTAEGDGGALYVTYDATITGSTFVNNTAFSGGDGGAVYAYSDVLITNSTFEGNTADDGGAVYVYYATEDGQGSSEISASTFTTNRGNSNGGAIYVQNDTNGAFNTAEGTRSAFTVSGSNFVDNTAQYDGGAILAGDFTLINDSTFTRNFAGNGDGGAIDADSYTSITDSTFIDNSADDDGGAVRAYSDLSISDSTFDGNSAYNGGAVYVNYASYERDGGSEITGSTFIDNNVDGYGGAVYVESASYAGFDTAEGTRAAFTIADSTFESNYSYYDGGAVYLAGYSLITNSTFTDNVSGDTDGGAIMIDEDYVRVIGSTFMGNVADDDGGAIYINSQYVYVADSTFEDNSASNGGAIYQDEEYAEITRSTFVNNHADYSGGAIYLERDDNQITSSTFVSNSADDGGAVYVSSNSDSNEIFNSTFVSNSADDQGGAIFAYYNIDIFFNTFLDNVSDSDFDLVNPKQNLGESLAIGEGEIVGNIFAGDSQYPQIQFFAGPYRETLEYNVSTGNDFDGVENNKANVSLSDLALDSELRDNQTTNFSQTLAITSSSSAAFGFVPLATAEQWLSDSDPETTENAPRDQRGVLRSASFVNAGAFEGFVSSSTPSVLSPATFFVQEVIAAAPKPGTVVKVSGLQLMKVTEVYVGGVKVKITKSSDGELSFKLPKSVTGAVQIRFVGAGHEHIHVMNVDGSIRNEAVVPGFGSNSTKLTKAMKNEIKTFVEANAGLTQVTCKGYTSAPATAQDLRLARERGQATCDYITKLNPALDVKVLAGAHTNTPGQKVRRVRIEMN